MKQTKAKIQFAAFLIYLVNNFLRIWQGKNADNVNMFWAYGIMFVLCLIYLYDYWFNYRKKDHFAVSSSVYFLFSITMWMVKGMWLLAGINILIWTFFILYKGRFAC